jgi:hypothetical protein
MALLLLRKDINGFVKKKTNPFKPEGEMRKKLFDIFFLFALIFGIALFGSVQLLLLTRNFIFQKRRNSFPFDDHFDVKPSFDADGRIRFPTQEHHHHDFCNYLNYFHPSPIRRLELLKFSSCV